MHAKALHLAVFLTTAVSALLLCQGIGWWVNSHIEVNTTLEINAFIHFTHIRNHGGVFGLAQGAGWLFGLISMTILAAVVGWLVLARNLQAYEYPCFGLVVGGGASNILDRLVHGSVIDFINLQHIPWWHYVFNTADVMIHLGIWPLLVLGLLLPRPDRNR